jgi:hypothetical protein
MNMTNDTQQRLQYAQRLAELGERLRAAKQEAQAALVPLGHKGA